MSAKDNIPRSAAWERFYESFFGDPYMAWHDGLDLGSIHELTENEKKEAEELLMGSDDNRAIVGLGELHSSKSLPTLRDKQVTATGTNKVNLAVAVNKISGDASQKSHIIDVLKNDPSPYSRLDAAMALRYFPSQDTITALYEGMLDEDFLVRYHSADSLLAIHGLPADISNYHDIFINIITKDDAKVTGEEVQKLNKAIVQLKELLNGKRTEIQD